MNIGYWIIYTDWAAHLSSKRTYESVETCYLYDLHFFGRFMVTIVYHYASSALELQLEPCESAPLLAPLAVTGGA